MSALTGQITYDHYFGHVCTCAETTPPLSEAATYDNTVKVAREIEPSESGTYWYYCERCGSGGWSGL